MVRKVSEIPESGTVTVACNVPTGLVLKLYGWEESEEAVLGGGMRTRKVAVETGDEVRLFGPALAKGAEPKCLIVSGYALTSGISAQFMQKWMRDNAVTALVKNECIFVYASENDARAAAKDRKDHRSGLEPIIPGVDAKGKPLDPRIPSRRNAQIGAIETATV